MSIQKLALPIYELTLPMSGKVIKFRPFTVKENKILMMAKEENNIDSFINAIGQLFDACTFGTYSIDTMNKLDAEFMFIALRNKSLGEGLDVNGICTDCGKKTAITLNLENFTIKNKDVKMELELSEGVWLKMRMPTLKESLSITDQDGYTAIAMCLDTLIDADGSTNMLEYPIADRIEWVESLSPVSFAAFKDFFEKVPMLEYNFDFKCAHCGVKNDIHIEGMESFFG